LGKIQVDVMVNTYNSQRCLEPCLRSIHANIPVRKLFVIDKFSQDNTIPIARKYDAEIVETNKSLAESRALGFKLVETSLFVNVDSDIVLPHDWFHRMMKYWNSPKIGCLWGVPIHMLTLHHQHQTSMYKFRNPCTYHIPFLPNMIARKDLLQDIQFPAMMKLGSVAGEDYEIMRWIQKKGFICKCAPVYCKHYTYPELLGKKTFWGGASRRLVSYHDWHGLLGLLRGVLLSFPQATFTSLASKNARLIPYWTRFRFEELYGFLHWNKYFDLKRGAQIGFVAS